MAGGFYDNIPKFWILSPKELNMTDLKSNQEMI